MNYWRIWLHIILILRSTYVYDVWSIILNWISIFSFSLYVMFCRRKSLSRQHRVGQVLSLNTWPRSRTWLVSFLVRWARSWSISSNHIARWMSSMKNWRRFWLRRDDFWVSPRQPPKNLEVNWTSSQGRLAWKLTHWTVVAMKVERQPLRISRKLLFPMERKSQRYNNNEFMNIAKPMWWVLSI